MKYIIIRYDNYKVWVGFIKTHNPTNQEFWDQNAWPSQTQTQRVGPLDSLLILKISKINFLKDYSLKNIFSNIKPFKYIYKKKYKNKVNESDMGLGQYENKN